MSLVSIAGVGGEGCQPVAGTETREPSKVLKSHDALEHLGAIADRGDEASTQLAFADSGRSREVADRARSGRNTSHNLRDQSCYERIRPLRIGPPLLNEIFKRNHRLDRTVRSIKPLP